MHALGLGGGGQVEGAGHGDAPVEEQGAVTLLADVQAHAAYVAAVELRLTGDGVLGLGGGIVDVDAAEDQAELGEVEAVEPGVEAVVLGLAADEGVGVRVGRIDLELHAAQALVGGGDLGVETREQVVNVVLLVGDLVVTAHLG